jgi:phospholipid/cholesterol/gamma-HCH transport system substrate-binding protein
LKISKEFSIGILFILAIIILVWGFNFLKNVEMFSKEKVLFAVYKNVDGLEPSGPIFINGVKVGQVSKVYFAPSLNGDIIVELKFKESFPIPVNSTSRIFSVDLMGSKAINIILGNSPDIVEDGDTLHTEVEASLKDAVNAQIAPIKVKAEQLLSSIDTMVVAIQGVFNKDIREDLSASIKSIRHTFNNLETTTQNLDTLVYTQSGRLSSIIYNIDMITQNLKNNSQEISRMLDNLATISDTIAQADIGSIARNLNNTITTLSNVLAKLDSGEGTLGMLINDDKLYQDLQKSAYELNRLIEDIRLNPKRYVRLSVF